MSTSLPQRLATKTIIEGKNVELRHQKLSFAVETYVLLRASPQVRTSRNHMYAQCTKSTQAKRPRWSRNQVRGPLPVLTSLPGMLSMKN